MSLRRGCLYSDENHINEPFSQFSKCFYVFRDYMVTIHVTAEMRFILKIIGSLFE